MAATGSLVDRPARCGSTQMTLTDFGRRVTGFGFILTALGSYCAIASVATGWTLSSPLTELTFCVCFAPFISRRPACVSRSPNDGNEDGPQAGRTPALLTSMRHD